MTAELDIEIGTTLSVSEDELSAYAYGGGEDPRLWANGIVLAIGLETAGQRAVPAVRSLPETARRRLCAPREGRRDLWRWRLSGMAGTFLGHGDSCHAGFRRAAQPECPVTIRWPEGDKSANTSGWGGVRLRRYVPLYSSLRDVPCRAAASWQAPAGR